TYAYAYAKAYSRAVANRTLWGDKNRHEFNLRGEV
ncbi:MAG: hypothetical protein HW402_1340, partial [Dehalococcoidales bacterium]|nr:hypothetical protein [Dehalococcoidales bacterium]